MNSKFFALYFPLFFIFATIYLPSHENFKIDQIEAKIKSKFKPRPSSIESLPLTNNESSTTKQIQKFNESQLAHQLLDGLRGIEIGGSAHNSFGLKTLNIDFTDEVTFFKEEEIRLCGEYMRVDIVAPGNDLPFKDNVWDFVINSHVVEHFYDPVATIKEWLRVVKPGGYVFMIVPHKERTFDRDRPRSTLQEIVDRHEHPNPPEIDDHLHYSVWITQDFLDICNYYQWNVVAVQDVDDKVGNGFTVVIQKSFQ